MEKLNMNNVIEIQRIKLLLEKSKRELEELQQTLDKGE